MSESYLERLHAEMAFLTIAIEEARRLVICTPDDVERIEQLVASLGVAHIVTVQANPWLPAGQCFVIDQNAIHASTNEAIQRMGRRL